MSDDLISRQAAIGHAISGLTREIEGEKWIRVSEVRESLKTMPSAQPERKKGKWIAVKVGNGDTRYTCSECGASYECDSRDMWDFIFCPICGAQNKRRTDGADGNDTIRI